MNSFLTSGAITGNKLFNNNSLDSIAPGNDLTAADNSFTSEFATLWQQLAATGGKDLPADNVEFNPDMIQQLAEMLEISPEEVLALPAPIVDFMSQALQQTNSVLLPGMFASENTEQLLSKAASNNDQIAAAGDRDLTDKLLSKFEQQLPRQALEQINLQKKSLDQNSIDNDLLRQLSMLKLVTSDAEQMLKSDSLLRDVQQGKVLDQLTAVDKLNPVSNVYSSNAVQTTSSQQALVQLPRVETPVGQAQWGQAVGERLMFMVNNKVQAASIILNPPELGPIEVKVNLNHDQASVHFVSNHAAVREAIEEAFPRLKEMFAQSGLQLADANVSQQSSQQRDQQTDGPLAMNVFSSDDDADVTQEHHDADMTAYVIDAGLVDHYV